MQQVLNRILELKESLFHALPGRAMMPPILLGIFSIMFIFLYIRQWITQKNPFIGKKDKNALRMAKRFARRGKYMEAGLLFESLQRFGDAASLFFKAGAFSKAGEIFLKEKNYKNAAESLEKGGQHERAAAVYYHLQDYSRAAESFQRAGVFKMAGEMHEKLGMFEKAGDNYRQAGLLRKAADMFLSLHRNADAAKMLEEAYHERVSRLSEGLTKDMVRGLKELAMTSANLYLEGGDAQAAAKMFEEAGLLRQAGEIYMNLGDHARASQLLLQAGESIKAAEALEKAGDTKESVLTKARAYLQKGQKIEAASHFEKGEEFLKSADLYHQLGEQIKAGEMYEKGGDYLKAGSSFRSGGDLKRAARCFEMGKDYNNAAEIYGRLGDYQKEAELLTVVGEFFKVGERLRARGLNDQAIKTLQLVEKISPDYRKASLLLGDIFHEKGMWSLAIEKYKDSIGGEPMDRANLGAHYNLAQVNEKSGDLKSSLSLYEKIMSLDYHFKDVTSRVMDVKKQLERFATPTPPGVDLYAQTAVDGVTRAPVISIKKRYSIIEERGRGGLGVVFKAKDTVLDRVVAFKVLHVALQDNPKALESFLREAKAAASLNHPNIVTVYDAGQDDGEVFISMEFVDGSTLKEILQEQGRIPVKASVLIAGQICRGLGYAHERKIVHRDIKPSNIMWTRKKVVKIMDFGLAKALEESRMEQTIVGGTPYYMSPEQTLGESVDHRSDIYSLGVTMFEIILGRLPFTSGDVGYHHVHTPPPDPRSIDPDIPESLSHAILTCMEKDPSRRYQSTKELFSDLKKLG